MVESLTFLLVSDIHTAHQRVDQVVKKNIQYDFTLVPGDLVKLKGSEYEDKQKVRQAYDDVKRMLNALSSITKQKLFVIPGNHDPGQMFDNQSAESYLGLKENPKIEYIHDRVVQVVPSLALAGFGGAPPGMLYLEPKKQAWAGYPFTTQESMAEAVNKHFSSAIEKLTTQCIMMTHCGPLDSSTTDFRQKGYPRIISGAQCWDTLLEKKHIQENICTWIHGHTHPARGMVHYTEVPIINPGSLKEDHYGSMVLTKVNDRWLVKTTQFFKLYE